MNSAPETQFLAPSELKLLTDEYVLNLIPGWEWKAALTPFQAAASSCREDVMRQASQDPQRHSTQKCRVYPSTG